jgi:hypothetical protein
MGLTQYQKTVIFGGVLVSLFTYLVVVLLYVILMIVTRQNHAS